MGVVLRYVVQVEPTNPIHPFSVMQLDIEYLTISVISHVLASAYLKVWYSTPR